MIPNILGIGNMSTDEKYFADKLIGTMPGGPVYFFSKVFNKLKIQFAVVGHVKTEALSRDSYTDLTFARNNDKLFILKIFESKDLRPHAIIEDSEVAKLEDLSIDTASIPLEFYNAIIISTLFKEVSSEQVKQIRQNFNGVLAIELQGYLREFQTGNIIKKVRPTYLESILSCADIIKLDNEEAKVILNKNIPDIIRYLHSFGAETVILTAGSKGSYISFKDKIKFIPSIEELVIETTGAGDTFLAAFMANYLTSNSTTTAGKFATNYVYKMLKQRLGR